MTATIGAAAVSTGDTVASVRDLRVSFRVPDGTVQALRGVDLDIAKGEIVALVGESGSGKSVLGSCLLGLPAASFETTITGSAMVGGVDMVSGPAKDRRAVRRHLLGAVFQDPLSSLNPTMRIGAQLTERAATKERAIAALVDAGVPEPERRFAQWPHELSGGLRQRVMLAMALTADGRPPGADDAEGLESAIQQAADQGSGPALIVADEPTTALDVSVQAQIVIMLDRLRREHDCSVLLITHDLGVAAAIADRVAVLYAGRICEIGPTAEVLAAPRHPYTAGLLRSRLSIDGRAQPVPIGGEPTNPLEPPVGCAFAARCPSATQQCVDELPEPMLADGRATACVHPLATDLAEMARSPLTGAVAAPVVLSRVRGEAAMGSGASVVGHVEPALTIEGVTKVFDIGRGRNRQQIAAVNEVSLSVPAGGAVALVGESGCGKTTLLRMATGILTPDSGSVRWPSDRGRPQLVFQDAGASLTPWLTIGRQVSERLGVLGVPKADRPERTIELLSRVGLDSRASRCRPRELSGGQRQRAAIARCLASEPKLLICDEPVSALDASLSVRVLELLEELRDTLGLATLVVTHDLAVARRVADEVAVMYLGRIVERAPVDELFDTPRHPYTNGLLEACPTAEPGRMAPTLTGEPPTPFDLPAGCAFAGRCAHAEPRCLEERPHMLRVEPDGDRRVACHVRPALRAQR